MLIRGARGGTTMEMEINMWKESGEKKKEIFLANCLNKILPSAGAVGFHF
jgi:hypothetical protein